MLFVPFKEKEKYYGGIGEMKSNLENLVTTEELEQVKNELALANEEILLLRTKLQLSETSEKLYKDVTEHAYDMIMRFAPDFTHLYANEASEKYLNIPAKDLIGKTHKELGFKESDYSFWEQEIHEVFTTGKPKKQVTAIENGSQWFDWWLIPEFNDEGKVESVLSYSRDISNIKAAEQKLLESEIKYKALSVNLQDKLQELSLSNFKLNESNQKLYEIQKELKQLNLAKDKLFSIISHDMKNPIAAIWTSCELLLKYLENNNIELAKAKGNRILEGIEYINQMLNDLLQWSMLQMGLINYQPEELDLLELSKNCISQIAIQAELKQIQLVNNSNKHFKINADPRMLRITIGNLLSNAVKFTESGGTIYLSSEKHENEVHIQVKDTGIGIEEEKLKTLFEVTEKKSSAGTQNEKGTGLGLLICKDFIKQHGGEILVESTLGKGSTFTIQIPA